MKKKILYLTNQKNSAPEEDRYLIGLLKSEFDVIFCHPLECEKYLSSVQAVIIRNIWPTYQYRDDWERIKKILLASGIPTYNPLTGKGDNKGKDYLVDLHKKGFPVIPSVDNVNDIASLGDPEFYWIKPSPG